MTAADKANAAMCEDDKGLNFVTSMTMSSLSVVGSTAIIVSFLLMNAESRAKLLRRLLCWLSLMDLGASGAYLLSPVTVSTQSEVLNDQLCVVQAVVSTFCSMSSFLTTCLIGIYLHQAVIDVGSHRSKVLHAHSKTVFVGVAVVLPLMLCSMVLATGKFGYSADFREQWCWIASDSGDDSWDTFMWRVIGGKGVEVLTIFVCAFTYVPTLIRLKKLNISDGNNAAISRLAFIPGAFVILRFPSLARTTVDFFVGPGTCVEVLSMLQALGDPSQGFVNGLAYATGSARVRELLQQALCCVSDGRRHAGADYVALDRGGSGGRNTLVTGGSKKKDRSNINSSKSWRDSSGVGGDIERSFIDSDDEELVGEEEGKVVGMNDTDSTEYIESGSDNGGGGEGGTNTITM